MNYKSKLLSDAFPPLVNGELQCTGKTTALGLLYVTAAMLAPNKRIRLHPENDGSVAERLASLAEIVQKIDDSVKALGLQFFETECIPGAELPNVYLTYKVLEESQYVD